MRTFSYIYYIKISHMNREEFRLNSLKKLDFILKVLNSCVTTTQVMNTQAWGATILVNIYSSSYGFPDVEVYKSGMVACATFDKNVTLKLAELTSAHV